MIEVKKLRTLVDKRFTQMDSWRTKMNKYWKYYIGEIWNQTEKTKLTDAEIGVVVNLFFSNINTAAPLMTDNEPKWSMRTRKPWMQKIGAVYKEIGECLYETLEMKQKTFLTVIDAFVFGKGMMKYYFDPEKEYGQGGVCAEVIDSRTFVYPKGYTDEWEMSWCGEVFQKPLDWIRLKYPELGMKVKPDSGSDEKVTNGDFMPDAQGYELTDSFATLYSIWIRDQETEKVMEQSVEKSASGEKVTTEKQVTRLKNPHGKIVVFCKSFDEPLEEKPYPYDHGKPPYVSFTDYIIPHSFEGIGEIQEIESLVLENNLLIRKICKFVHDWADPNFYADDDSNIDPTKWKKDAPGGGNLFLKRSGTNPPQTAMMPPYNATAIELVGALAKYVDEITGINETTKGMVTKKQRQSKFEVQSLLETSYTRPRQKIRNLDQFISRSFFLILSIAQQYFTEPRTYSKKKPDGYSWSKISNSKEFANKVYDPGQPPQPTGNEDEDKMAQGQYDRDRQDFEDMREHLGEKDELRFDFEIQVESGSYLPLDRQSKANLYMTLADKKVGPDSLIGPKALYKALQLPEADEIIEELKAMQAANLQLKQGAQPGGQ